MNITEAKYHQYEGVNSCIEAIIDGQSIIVPLDAPDNRHYAEILKQVKEGTLTIKDAE
tara:strand:+ start:789 stop:962 length:174 start_codon:yes stop_codon:yes gene_type:complete